MATGNTAWGIEIGQCALKAIKLRSVGDGQVEVVAFDLIEHPKILSQPDADPDELIHAALEKFVSRNDWQGDPFVLGVPGQQTFSRFTKLPPVEEKKIADIVKYEAQQQIPFDMDDVVWDYEVFRAEGTPDVEVGIFAMRKDLVRKQIEYFSAHGISPTAIQTLPSALYNFCRFDGQGKVEGDTATVVIDVGAQKTDLIIVENNSSWTRNIPLGGNNFTEALVKSFKLSFAKAESLKRTAATSKYTRQIFQAMRPVFADLLGEVQRSIGFYSSTHREVQLHQVLACGNAFRLPGLQKYLESNLSFPGGVARLEKFNRAIPSQTSNAPQFTENLLSFGAVYGLAVQGLGLAKISANLLPTELERLALWKRKTPYFAATAACLLLSSSLPWVRSAWDAGALRSGRDLGEQARQIISRHETLRNEFQKVQTDNSGKQASIEKLFELQKNRALLPAIVALVHEAAPVPPELADANTPEEIRKRIEAAKGRLDRTQRRQVFIDSVRIRYSKDIENEARTVRGTSSYSSGGAGPGRGRGDFEVPERGGGLRGEYVVPVHEETAPGAASPGFYVHITGRLLFGRVSSEVVGLIESEFYSNLMRLGRRAGLGFYIPEKDSKNLGGRNLGGDLHIERYYSEGQPGRTALEPAARGGGFRGDMVLGGDAPVAAAGAGVQPESHKPLDPVTGEDMSTDWRFEFGFKVKLGDPPAEAPADDAAAGG